MPASKRKPRDRAHPPGRGLHRRLASRRRPSPSTCSWSSSSTAPGPRARHLRPQARLQARPPHLRIQGPSARASSAASACAIMSTSNGVITAAEAGKRGIGGEVLRVRVVSVDEPYRTSPHPRARRRRGRRRARPRRRSGPEGLARPGDCRPTWRSRSEDAHARRDAPDRPRRPPRAARPRRARSSRTWSRASRRATRSASRSRGSATVPPPRVRTSSSLSASRTPSP